MYTYIHAPRVQPSRLLEMMGGWNAKIHAHNKHVQDDDDVKCRRHMPATNIHREYIHTYIHTCTDDDDNNDDVECRRHARN
jgi:hypothetical protein